MTTGQVMVNSSTAEEHGPGSPLRIAEHLADGLWQLTDAWHDFAKNTKGVPLLRALDEVGLQLWLTLGHSPFGSIYNISKIPVGH